MSNAGNRLLLCFSFTILFYRIAGIGIIQRSRATHKFPPGAQVGGDAPVCTGSEPCGYYTFNFQGEIKWLRTWCHCAENHACTYASKDRRRRALKFVCLHQNQLTQFMD